MADDPLLRVSRIAAGEFVMGAEDGEDDERPRHRAYIDEFAIGVCPVTNDEYAQFVRDTHHPSPAIRTLPLVGGINAASIRMVVVFPAPFGPSNAKISPGPIVKFRRSTAINR